MSSKKKYKTHRNDVRTLQLHRGEVEIEKVQNVKNVLCSQLLTAKNILPFPIHSTSFCPCNPPSQVRRKGEVEEGFKSSPMTLTDTPTTSQNHSQ